MTDITATVARFVIMLRFLSRIVAFFTSHLGLTGNSNAFLITMTIGVIASFISNLILTRILAPELFAVAGLIASYIFVTHLISDIGVTPFIVRHKDGLDQDLLDTIWTVRWIRGIILCVVTALCSVPITKYMGFAHLAPVVLVCSLLFVLEAFQSMSPITSEHSNSVARPLFIELFINLCSKGIIILVAHQTGSYWAFIAGLFLAELLKIYTSRRWYPKQKRRLKISNKYILDLWDFLKVILPSSFLTILLSQGDKIILAKTLDLSELGLYFLALSYAGIASSFITGYSNRVLLPEASVLVREDFNNLSDLYYRKKTNILSWATFAFGLLAGASVLLVSILYTVEYSGAAFLITLLLIHPALCCFSNPAETQLFAAGYTRVAFFTNFFRVIWVFLASWPAYEYLGSVGVVLVLERRRRILGIRLRHT